MHPNHKNENRMKLNYPETYRFAERSANFMHKRTIVHKWFIISGSGLSAYLTGNFSYFGRSKYSWWHPDGKNN